MAMNAAIAVRIFREMYGKMGVVELQNAGPLRRAHLSFALLGDPGEMESLQHGESRSCLPVDGVSANLV